MKKEIKVWVTVLLVALALVAGVYWGSMSTVRKYGRTAALQYDAGSAHTAKLNAIWRLVERNYVDNVDNDTVMDRVYSAMLAALDPHSSYVPREELSKQEETLRGNFEGVGIVIRKINDTVRVAQVMPGGPSEKAGLEAGDKLLQVDGITLSGCSMDLSDVVKHLRGPRKSIADLKISRPGEGGSRYVKVVRDIIMTPSISYSGMLDDKTGYINLDSFTETSLDEFREALRSLKKQGMERLVFDLRGNGGGVMGAATGICDELLGGNELILYTQGAHDRRSEIHSRPGGLFTEGELIVMIDEFSASASEIVAGAMQDNDRGIIAGRRSFGKGLVQRGIDLPDRSAVNLTVARYYTPSGRCIQRPYDKGKESYAADFGKKLAAYAENKPEMQPADSTPYYTTQGRVVYGGGGIWPDHTISYYSDTDFVYVNALIYSGLINDFTFDMAAREGHNIKREYATGEDFVARYKVSDKTIEELLTRAEDAGLKRDKRSLAKYREEVRSRIKAEIGEMLYSNATFYAIEMRNDPDIIEAMKLFNKKKSVR